MKRLILIPCVAVLALAQTPVRHGEVEITADQMNNNGTVRHLVGHVTIESDVVLVRADDADYNDNTGEIVAHGDVHVKLK
jgi:lipopolysaccharide assembly outer membrane protein LptD (OstA)